MSDQQQSVNSQQSTVNKEELIVESQQQQDDLSKRIEELQKLAEENLNGWKRTKADLINFKREIEEERKGWMTFALVGVILKFLPVLDHLNAALEIPHAELPDERLKNFITGIENTKKQFEVVLKDFEVIEIGGVGVEFDPLVHESVEKDGEVTGKGKLVVAKVLVRGYKMKEQVLRPAKVVVKEVIEEQLTENS